MKVDWPNNTLVEALPAPALKAEVIISLFFLIVRNVLSGRLSVLRMAAVDSPLSYSPNTSLFCSRVINFLLVSCQEECPFHLDHAVVP